MLDESWASALFSAVEIVNPGCCQTEVKEGVECGQWITARSCQD